MQPAIGPIEHFMTEDHVRLDRLLLASEHEDGHVDEPTFARFRHDLLRHIAMEEKVLLPFARERRGGEPLAVAPALRRDHGEIAKLLVRAPTAATLTALRELLARHNQLEEGDAGLYATCDALAGSSSTDVVARLREQPTVPVAKYYEGPIRPRSS
ncbi:MAG: hemerythrin domain-containing protein [Labilithrix sp.]|nr:hemerythrin domain-containing protein [Labilithrix sp.]MCW5812524.1 hemerythrin domain-containing protein [Labilithrix sp.]